LLLRGHSRFFSAATSAVVGEHAHPLVWVIVVTVVVFVFVFVFGSVGIVGLCLFYELAVGGLVVWRRDPFLGDHAGQGEAYARGAVDPGRGGFAGELFAEVRGEMVAVV